MSLRACLAWGQDTSGLDVCSWTTLGTALRDSRVVSKYSWYWMPWLTSELSLLEGESLAVSADEGWE